MILGLLGRLLGPFWSQQFLGVQNHKTAADRCQRGVGGPNFARRTALPREDFYLSLGSLRIGVPQILNRGPPACCLLLVACCVLRVACCSKNGAHLLTVIQLCKPNCSSSSVTIARYHPYHARYDCIYIIGLTDTKPDQNLQQQYLDCGMDAVFTKSVADQASPTWY